MKMAKRIVSMMLALVMMLALAACGGGGSEESGDGNNTVITFAGWGSLAEKKIFTSMIDDFEKSHPGVKVNYQHVPGTQEDYLVKLTSLLAANKMPDVFYIHSDEFYSWADADRLENLTPYYEASEVAKNTTQFF